MSRLVPRTLGGAVLWCLENTQSTIFRVGLVKLQILLGIALVVLSELVDQVSWSGVAFVFTASGHEQNANYPMLFVLLELGSIFLTCSSAEQLS